jgi:hypothetical protein
MLMAVHATLRQKRQILSFLHMGIVTRGTGKGFAAHKTSAVSYKASVIVKTSCGYKRSVYQTNCYMVSIAYLLPGAGVYL